MKNIIFLVIFFVLSSNAVAQNHTVFETDNSGKIIYGSYKNLRNALLNGADLRVGLGTHSHNEVFFFSQL